MVVQIYRIGPGRKCFRWIIIACLTHGRLVAHFFHSEALGCGSFDFNRGYKLLDENAMRAMWKQSPMAYENGAIGPTLLALGLKDRRVHHSQGIEWYRALKTRGVNIKLLTYEHHYCFIYLGC